MYYILFSFLIFFNLLFIYINNRKRKELNSFFPILTLVSAIYSIIGVLLFDFAIDVPFDFFRISTYENINNAILYFLFCSLMYSLGVTVINFLYIRTKSSDIVDRKGYIQVVKDRLAKIPSQYFVFLTALWLVLFIPSYGLNNLFYRTEYRIDVSERSLLIFSNIIFPVSVISMGLIRNRFLRYSFLLSFLCVNILSSSRIVIICFLLYLVGTSIRLGKFNLWKTIIVLLLSVWMSAFTLYIRHSPVQGIQNIFALFQWFEIDTIAYAINYFTSFSVGVLSYAITSPIDNGAAVLLYSLNPLPSFIFDARVSESNLLGAAPYSAISILYTESYLGGGVYFFIVGAIFKFFEEFSFKNSYYTQWLFCGCMTIIFTFLSMQYTLRASTRIVYYLIFFMILFSIFRYIKKVLSNVR